MVPFPTIAVPYCHSIWSVQLWPPLPSVLLVDYLRPSILEVSVEKERELHPIEHVLEQLSCPSNICGAETFFPDEFGACSSSAGMGSSLSCSTSRKPRMMAEVNSTWGIGPGWSYWRLPMFTSIFLSALIIDPTSLRTDSTCKTTSQTELIPFRFDDLLLLFQRGWPGRGEEEVVLGVELVVVGEAVNFRTAEQTNAHSCHGAAQEPPSDGL